MGGKVTAASGALDRKGDVRAPEHLYEAKWTGKKSFTLKSEVLEKITREALIEGRTPVLQIELNGRTYAVVEWETWLETLSV